MRTHILFITKIIISIALLLALLNCKSNPKIEEVSYPESPYFADASFNAHIVNKDLLSKYAKNYGIDSPFIINFVEYATLSVTNSNATLVSVKSGALNVKRKLDAMKNIGAIPLDEKELDLSVWKYADENGLEWFFDLRFEQALMISNFETNNIVSMLDWDVPTDIVQVQASGTSQGWFWNSQKGVADSLPIQGFSLNWIAVNLLDYSLQESTEVDFMLNFSGNKSARATVKLILPALLGSFGVITGSSLPELELVDYSDNSSIIIRSLEINTQIIDLYMQ